MAANVSAIGGRPKVRLRAVALPIEHGSWGLLFEPLVAAAAIAPSVASPWIILMVIGFFLARQPLKVALSDIRSGRWLPQTNYALRFLSLYSGLSAIGLVGAVATADTRSFIPFGLVMPFAAYQIYCDSKRDSRQLWAELLGSVAISSSAAAIALAADRPAESAAALWAVFVGRSMPSILYVRNRLLLEKGKPFARSGAIVSHVAAAGGVFALALFGLIPYLTAGLFVVLLARAVIGLSPYRRRVKAKKIGIAEVIYGTLTVLTLIIGYYLGI